MITKLFEHIGGKIKLANPWINTYSVNCIELPDGRVVNFEGAEKEDKGFDDTKGFGFYIKTNPIFTYTLQRQLSSSTREYLVNIDYTFVFYSINADEQLSQLKLEQKFTNDFRTLNFLDYTGNERKPKILLVKSNSDALLVFKNEIKLDETKGTDYNFGANSVFISVDAKLQFLSSNDCEGDCGTLTSANIIQTINFCDPQVIKNLCSTQVQCLKQLFADEYKFIDLKAIEGANIIDGNNKIFIWQHKPLQVYLQGNKLIIGRITNGYTLTGNDTGGWTTTLTEAPSPASVDYPADSIEAYGNYY